MTLPLFEINASSRLVHIGEFAVTDFEVAWMCELCGAPATREGADPYDDIICFQCACDDERHEPPTPRQRDVLIFIRGYHTRTRLSPTVREIMDAIGIRSESTTAVIGHLQELRRKGFIEWEEGKSRTIRARIVE